MRATSSRPSPPPTLDLRLVLGNYARPAGRAASIAPYPRARAIEVLDREPTIEERRRFPAHRDGRPASAGYPAERTPLDHPLAQALSQRAAQPIGPLVVLPSLGGSLPLYLIRQELGAPSVTLGLVEPRQQPACRGRECPARQSLARHRADRGADHRRLSALTPAAPAPGLHRAIWAIALPSMLTNVATALFGLADLWVIGQLGRGGGAGRGRARRQVHDGPAGRLQLPAHRHDRADRPGGRPRRRGGAGGDPGPRAGRGAG